MVLLLRVRDQVTCKGEKIKIKKIKRQGHEEVNENVGAVEAER